MNHIVRSGVSYKQAQELGLIPSSGGVRGGSLGQGLLFSVVYPLEIARKPNIVYILADDMGYGDMRCNNPDSRIPTPSLDRLAAQGMRFTDAHASSSVCTPSRYSILTGRYCWRAQLKRSVLWPWDPPLIAPDQPTVPGLLRRHGYRAACIGKWHLGWEWANLYGKPAHEGTEIGKVIGWGVQGSPFTVQGYGNREP